MEKLPQEIISEIVSNLESCKDILNFCMTNSKNKEQCKKALARSINIHIKLPDTLQETVSFAINPNK